MKNSGEWYEKKLADTIGQLQQVSRFITYISAARLLLFVGIVATMVWLWGETVQTILAALTVTVLPFLLMVKLHSRFFMEKQWLEIQKEVLEKELKGLEHDFSDFDEGKEFINPAHLYSYDLDLFGRKSLFQAVNRTCTHVGKITLAHWMQEHLKDKSAILRRQRAVEELSGKNDFRLRFAITGLMCPGKENDVEDITRWMTKESKLSKLLWVKIILAGVPLVNLVALLAGVMGWISLSWSGFLFSLFVVLSFSVIQRATVLQDEYHQKLGVLSVYAKLISLIQGQQWESEEIKELSQKLNIEGKSPSDALNALTKELDRMDLRNNQLLYVILEGSLFFQLRQMVRIERWKDKYGKYLQAWLQSVGEVDALCSLATFSFNHSDYVYPEISDCPFCFEAVEMGHPLMPVAQCVKNDAVIPSRPYFLIVTGANMAGKSTYLRTIGINYLLACMGMPVCCRKLKVYPSQLITSLRTSDSLSDNESYFFAELKRLQRIIERLNRGEELFIILDEILKGTNSADKQKGSFSLIRQFMLLKANGIIATHDLLLGELVNHFPGQIKNYCFEADIKDNELSFSYKMREGIAQNMNACFLMKKMGIVMDEEVEMSL